MPVPGWIRGWICERSPFPRRLPSSFPRSSMQNTRPTHPAARAMSIPFARRCRALPGRRMTIRNSRSSISVRPPSSAQTDWFNRGLLRWRKSAVTNPNRRPEKSPWVASRVIDETVLLVPVRQRGPNIQKLYRLNGPVASKTWGLINGRRTAREIHRCLCQEFDTDPQRVERDLSKLLKHLESIGIVRVAQRSVQKRRTSRR